MERPRPAIACGEKKHARQKTQEKNPPKKPGYKEKNYRKERGGNSHYNKKTK